MDEESCYRVVTAGLKGTVLRDELLNSHTTFFIGGPADVWVEPAGRDELVLVLDRVQACGCRWMVLGSGSNVLVNDDGFHGVVIHIGESFSETSVRGTLLAAGGGCPVAKAMAAARDAGLGGLEWCAGIPGTTGGAIVTNAGAHGVSFGDIVREARFVSPGKGTFSLSREAMGFTYRGSGLPAAAVVTDVELELVERPRHEIDARVKELIELRRDRQPVGARTAGSVYKNPPGAAAGRLIEEAGLAGCRSGGAKVSEKHANFIVNDGSATARDVLALMERIEEEVWKQSGVRLEREIHLLG